MTLRRDHVLGGFSLSGRGDSLIERVAMPPGWGWFPALALVGNLGAAVAVVIFLRTR